MTATTAEPSPLEVLRAGTCTDSACLLSAEGNGPCRCRCGGSGHGALRAAITRQAEASTPAARKLSRAARRRRK